MGTTGQSITLANSIIGVGILAMPFCFQQCGMLLATLILLLMGLVSRLCCYFLLKSALIARRRNFEFLAFHVFGSAGKLAVELGIIGFLMGTCIAYFVVVGDLGPQIVSKMFNINQSDILRTSIMVIVSLVCVLPLGLLRNVDSLSNVSAATIGFYFCLVIKVITEAASQLLAGDWEKRFELWRPAGVLQCVPIFSMALFCQTQLFEIFESLPTLSLEKMNVVTKNAINICTGVYFTLGLFGYIAFSSHEISGNILMSLSPTMASDVIKLGFVMSLAFSFPLIIFPCRASLYSFLYKKVQSTHHDHIINHSIPATTFRCITVSIIAVALFISLLIPNIELVLGLVGSTIGVLICMVFPAACFVNVTFKNTNERVLAKAVLVLGLVIMVLGTYANLQAADSRPDRYDDNITPERIDKIVEDFFQKMEKNQDFKARITNEDISHKEANNVDKDSEVQPPNPVPPESSNEKGPIVDKPNIDDKKQEILKPILPQVENVVDKVSESHPRNIQTKINEAKSNGEKVDENKSVEKPKEEKPNLQQKTQDKIDMIKQQQLIDTIKQHGEEQKELIKEQKEILDEIMKTKKELQQNKKELGSEEAKKIAVESIQKIAKVAIQSLSGVSDKPAQIEIGDKKAEPLEKIANDAVQEIAKKVVETIEAIKEKENAKEPAAIPENKRDVANANVPISNALPSNINQVPVQNNAQVIQNAQPVQNVNPQANVNNVNPANNAPAVQNLIPSAQPLQQNGNILPINEKRSVNGAQSLQQNGNFLPVNEKPSNNASVANALPAVNPNDQVQVPSNNIPNQPVLSSNQNIPPVQNQVKLNVDSPQDHLHSPDEPQSYKQGEDSQNNAEQKIYNEIKRAPLPLAMNGNSQVIGNSQLNGNPQINSNPQIGNSQISNGNSQTNNQIPNVNNINKPEAIPSNKLGNNNLNLHNNVNSVQNNGAIKNTVENNVETLENKVPVRQKREVIDCAEKHTLKPEDKEVCDTLLSSPKTNKISEEILSSKVDPKSNKIPKEILSSKVDPKTSKISDEILSSNVDLNDAILPKLLPVDTMVHHIRSLKSYDETEKRR